MSSQASALVDYYSIKTGVLLSLIACNKVGCYLLWLALRKACGF